MVDRLSPSGPRYQIGDRINQQFTVLDAPRLGGMGEVYRCRDEASAVIVAVKTLRQDHLRSPAFDRLIRKEAATWLELGKQRNFPSVVGRIAKVPRNPPFSARERVNASGPRSSG